MYIHIHVNEKEMYLSMKNSLIAVLCRRKMQIRFILFFLCFVVEPDSTYCWFGSNQWPCVWKHYKRSTSCDGTDSSSLHHSVRWLYRICTGKFIHHSSSHTSQLKQCLKVNISKHQNMKKILCTNSVHELDSGLWKSFSFFKYFL